ncbi:MULTISPECIES: hypothetical protein [Corynebacterium]|uniref:Uncharacterized protein n=1 Tax=Corynebacterium hadale TaxID=2026255 RepID=A0A269PCD7_9CORY|nr:hypothetical protein [Corynebacterium hadale]PAJ69468.1 hypothetical protein CIG21_07795 [Corynebacterium hadale]WKC59343.1 hypothetical protein CHAD_02155 [Corynebacterium hadale]
MFPSDIRSRVTPIPTPLAVRAAGSAGVAGSVAVMASSAPIAVRAGVALACIAVALGVTLVHPYRRAMREYAAQQGASTVASISMLVPLMLWWLLLMLAPLLQWPVWGALLVFVGLFALAWLLFPHVDGSRRLAYA